MPNTTRRLRIAAYVQYHTKLVLFCEICGRSRCCASKPRESYRDGIAARRGTKHSTRGERSRLDAHNIIRLGRSSHDGEGHVGAELVVVGGVGKGSGRDEVRWEGL